MSRLEESREDLLGQATALVERIELQLETFDEPVVAGFRRDGSASFFFGQQVVLQFNTDKQLRRGFFDGRLLKAECGRFVELTRQRTADAVNLLRHDLTSEETSTLLIDAGSRLRQISEALSCGRFRVVGQIPEQADVARRVREWILSMPQPIPIAPSPRVG